jgi:hypothetical protein
MGRVEASIPAPPGPNAGRAADCLQRSLRSRFRQQLTPSVRLLSEITQRCYILYP